MNFRQNMVTDETGKTSPDPTSISQIDDSGKQIAWIPITSYMWADVYLPWLAAGNTPA